MTELFNHDNNCLCLFCRQTNPDKDTNLSEEQLRDLRESISVDYRYQNEDTGMTFEEAEADLNRVIAAAQTQLLTEMMGQAEEYEKWVGGSQATGKATTVKAVPIEVFNQYLKGLK